MALLARSAFEGRVSTVGGQIPFRALLESVTVSVHLQDVNVMGTRTQATKMPLGVFGIFLCAPRPAGMGDQVPDSRKRRRWRFSVRRACPLVLGP
jgi:hypothetical protein